MCATTQLCPPTRENICGIYCSVGYEKAIEKLGRKSFVENRLHVIEA